MRMPMQIQLEEEPPELLLVRPQQLRPRVYHEP